MALTKEQLTEELRRLTPTDRRELLAQFPDEAAAGAAPRVFLSYSRDDTLFVRDLMAGLEHSGVQVWFDVRELLVGEDYLIATEKGLKECNYCLVVVSPYSMKSMEVARELAIARTAGTAILPVILQDAAIADPLRNLQWVDFRFHFEEPLAALVDQLHGRPSFGLSQMRLHSATKPLVSTGGFVPLLHKNMPRSILWFCVLLLAGALGVSFAGIVYINTVPLWFGVLFVYSLLLGFQAFRVADRREPLSALRGSIWTLATTIPFLIIPFATILEPKPRHLVWGLGAFSTLALVGAVLVSEFSIDFRRRLPARLARMPVLPAWMQRRKQPASQRAAI